MVVGSKEERIIGSLKTTGRQGYKTSIPYRHGHWPRLLSSSSSFHSNIYSCVLLLLLLLHTIYRQYTLAIEFCFCSLFPRQRSRAAEWSNTLLIDWNGTMNERTSKGKKNVYQYHIKEPRQTKQANHERATSAVIYVCIYNILYSQTRCNNNNNNNNTKKGLPTQGFSSSKWRFI
jgi:hypothetical protein